MEKTINMGFDREASVGDNQNLRKGCCTVVVRPGRSPTAAGSMGNRWSQCVDERFARGDCHEFGQSAQTGDRCDTVGILMSEQSSVLHAAFPPNETPRRVIAAASER